MRGTSSGNYTDILSDSATSPYVDNNLVNGTTYYYLIKAVNSSGITLADKELHLTPLSPMPGSFSISSAQIGNSSVQLTWTSSTDATNYTVAYGTVSGSYPTVVSNSATSPTTVTGLTNGTSYYFMVAAQNASGYTNASSEVSAQPEPLPGSFNISSIVPNDGQLTINWTTASAATSYILKYGTVSGSYPTVVSNSATSPTTVTGLTNGTSYYFMVAAQNASGYTNASSEVSAQPAPPSPPGSFTISSFESNNSQITINWTAANAATSYILQYGTSSGSYPTVVSSLATSPTTVTGLTNGTNYYFMVVAHNNYGDTNASSELGAIPTSIQTGPNITYKINNLYNNTCIYADPNVSPSLPNGGCSSPEAYIKWQFEPLGGQDYLLKLSPSGTQLCMNSSVSLVVCDPNDITQRINLYEQSGYYLLLAYSSGDTIGNPSLTFYNNHNQQALAITNIWFDINSPPIQHKFIFQQ